MIFKPDIIYTLYEKLIIETLNRICLLNTEF